MTDFETMPCAEAAELRRKAALCDEYRDALRSIAATQTKTREVGDDFADFATRLVDTIFSMRKTAQRALQAGESNE